MSQLWPMIALGQVIQYRKEFIEIDDFAEYKRCRVQLYAQGVVLRDTVPGVEIKTKQQQVCQAGEFLVAEIDAKLGGYGIAPEELDGAIVSSHYFLYVIDETKLDRRFLSYFIRTHDFFDQVSAKGSTNYAAIRPHHVLEYKIPLPPLDEQRRIVARIEALAAKVEQAQRLRQRSAGEVEVLPNSAKNQVFGEDFQTKWPSMPLGEISDIGSGVTLGRSLTGSTITVPYLRVANVQDGYLDLHQVKKIEIREDEFEKWKLVPGDLLLTEGGDWDKLGRGTVWQGEIERCIHQNHIFRVRVSFDEFDPHYLSALISSPYGKAYFQESSKQTTNLASINKRQLRSFVVFKPPLSEQRRIVAYLDNLQAKVEAVKRHQAATAARLESLLPSILDRAFRGEL
ncbi:MAG: restriction endonuclease subunit S [Chloroflexi bacterium]|nr:restriction endonuclease subunit S [Chloroflexota bacterium]